MNTKQRILDAALTLFAEKGYANVFVGQIAEAVGIKAPSLYKHFRSKQDIFNAILDEIKRSYEKQSGSLNMDGNDPTADAMVFSAIDEDELVRKTLGLFLYFLHDEYTFKFRRMLTLEQYHDSDLSLLLSKQYVDDPLAHQSTLFAVLCAGGFLDHADTDIMALQLYSPVYLLLTMCDRQPEREPEAISLLERHVRQFNRLYRKEQEK